MPEPPRLQAVPSPGEGSGPTPAAEPAGGRGSRAVWLLAILLVLALAGIAFEARQASRLEQRVDELSEALAEAEATVAAHRDHLAAIQGRVGGLRAELEALEKLVRSSPEASPER